MRKLNERTKPIEKQIQFGRTEQTTRNELAKRKDIEVDGNEESQGYPKQNTQTPSGLSPKQTQQDKLQEYETQRVPETPPKQVQRVGNSNGKTWSPPSSQKRMSLDSPMDKLDNGRLKSPSKATLRLPSRSPLRRSSENSRLKGSLSDPFDLTRIADGVSEELFPSAEQTTGNGSTLSSTEWSAVNRRQPMRLGSSSSADTKERSQATDRSILGTQQPSQIAASLSPQTTRFERAKAAGEGSPKKRISTDDDYSTITKRQRIAESLSDNPSGPPRTMVLTVNTAGQEKTWQKEDTVKGKSESTPADLTDSIRTAY